MDVPLSVLEHVQTEHSHTECPPLEPLNLTVINTTRIKIRHYRQVYTERSDPIVFLPVSDYTSSPVYDDFVLLIFLHTYREASILGGELPEESGAVSFCVDYMFGNEGFCRFDFS